MASVPVSPRDARACPDGWSRNWLRFEISNAVVRRKSGARDAEACLLPAGGVEARVKLAPPQRSSPAGHGAAGIPLAGF